MNPPRRIVSLLSSATEIVCDLGLADQLLAISHECDYPPEIAGRPRATRAIVDSRQSSDAIDRQVKSLLNDGLPLYEFDRDLLRSLRPDLVVTQAQCDVCAVKHRDVLDFVAGVAELRDTTVLALNPSSLDDVLNDLLRIGRATGRTSAAEARVAEYRRRIESVRARAAVAIAAGRRPRVVCIEWIEPLMVAGNWTPQLLEWAGGEPGLAEPGGHSRYVGWDELAAFDPQVVVVAPCGFDLRRTRAELPRLEASPFWARLSAVRDGRVHLLDGNAYLNRSGPRLVETLERLAAFLAA